MMQRVHNLKQWILGHRLPLISACIVTMILALAFVWRVNTFWLAHSSGDQVHYLGLAVKLDTLGFDHYNLRGLKSFYIRLNNNDALRLRYMIVSDDPEERGDILTALAYVGIRYYDQPFYHKPPGIPYLLVLSHRFFATKNQPFSVVATNIAEYLDRIKPAIFFEAQFWAVIVPLFFSLGSILLTFVVGKMLFSPRVGWYAAAMVAMHPVAIFTAHKIWAADMIMFFITLALILFIQARQRHSLWWAMVAGMSCGCAVLAKQTGGYMLIAIGVFVVIDSMLSRTLQQQGAVGKQQHVLVAGRLLGGFIMGTFLVSGFWFIKIYQIYGNPLWLPAQENLVVSDITGWTQSIRSRPPGWILYAIGVPYLCPLLVGAYYTFIELGKSLIAAFKKKAYDYRFVLLWTVILSFYIILRNGSEHRRFLPAYPMIAVCAGYAFDRLRLLLSRRIAICQRYPFIPDILIAMVFIACAAWSVPIGIHTALFEMRESIRIPF